MYIRVEYENIPALFCVYISYRLLNKIVKCIIYTGLI